MVGGWDVGLRALPWTQVGQLQWTSRWWGEKLDEFGEGTTLWGGGHSCMAGVERRPRDGAGQVTYARGRPYDQ